MIRKMGDERPDARSAVEHRPADLVPRPLVVEDERADRLRELVTLPPALDRPAASLSPSGAAACAALIAYAAAPSSCAATCATTPAWPAA